MNIIGVNTLRLGDLHIILIFVRKKVFFFVHETIKVQKMSFLAIIKDHKISSDDILVYLIAHGPLFLAVKVFIEHKRY